MNRLAKIRRALLLLLFWFIAIVAAHFAAGNTGLSFWKNMLGPGEPIKELLSVEVESYPGTDWIYKGRPTVVYIETTGGKYYSYSDKMNYWSLEKIVSSNQEGSHDCSFLSGLFEKLLLKNKIACLSNEWHGEWDDGKIMYVLMDNDEIWYRKQYQAPMIAFWYGCIITPFFIVLYLGISIFRFIGNKVVTARSR